MNIIPKGLPNNRVQGIKKDLKFKEKKEKNLENEYKRSCIMFNLLFLPSQIT
jgi:hypothetical protein